MSYLCEIILNIILPSTIRSPKRPLPLRFSEQHKPLQRFVNTLDEQQYQKLANYGLPGSSLFSPTN